MAIVLDIETVPRPEADIRQVIGPFDIAGVKLGKLAKPLGEFDPASVKHGLTKDPGKIAAKIEECRQKHAAAVASREEEIKQLLVEAEAEFWQTTLENAALRAELATVAAVGWKCCKTGEKTIYLAEDVGESGLLKLAWQAIQDADLVIGHYLAPFDLPFLLRRSWILGIHHPTDVFDRVRKYFAAKVIDLVDVWRCGDRQLHISLGKLSRAFEIGDKNGDGANFGTLDRAGKILYLGNDLDLTHGCALKMNVCLSSDEHTATSPPPVKQPTIAASVTKPTRGRRQRSEVAATGTNGAANHTGQGATAVAEPPANGSRRKLKISTVGTHPVDPFGPGEWEDAIEQCARILDKIDELPERAEEFGGSVSEKVGDICATIEAAQRVTPGQLEALANMEAGIDRWLERQ